MKYQTSNDVGYFFSLSIALVLFLVKQNKSCFSPTINMGASPLLC